MTRYEVPARIPETVRRQLVADSLSVYRLCQCRDLARVDFLFRHDGRPVFLEINTIPGMTPTSLLPKAAACEGITFSELIDRWIGFVLKRRLEGGTL